jgi:hypothetical protein
MSSIIAILVLIAIQQVPPPPAQGAPPPCAVSDDPSYGLTLQNPVPIGGGAMYVAARERRYLDALRGPQGQPIRYKRLGSMVQAPNNHTIIDHYEVTYDGLEKPISLYLDVYHYWEQRAPKGFICGQPMQLQPMLDNFQALESLMSTAVEQGATRDFTPIPLDADGTTTHGVLWDGFRTVAMASRAAATAGSTRAPASRPEGGTIVLAYPLSCDGRSVAPVTIDLVPPQGPPLPRNGDLVKDAAIARLLPGANAPAGSLAARFQIQQVPPTDRVRITYAEAACPQGTTEVLLPLTFTAARPGDFSLPPLPEGANPAEKRLLLQVLIDLDGKLQRVTYVGGPTHLQQAAIDAARTWRAEPARINGSPVPTATLLEMRFK